MSKVYIEDIAAYNEGILHGCWVDLDDCSDVADINEAIETMLKASPIAGAEEWQISDYDAFGGIDAAKYSFDMLLKINEALNQYPVEIVSHVLDVTGDNFEADLISDHFLGSDTDDGVTVAWELLGADDDSAFPEWLTGRCLEAAVKAWLDSAIYGGEIISIRSGAETILFNAAA